VTIAVMLDFCQGVLFRVEVIHFQHYGWNLDSSVVHYRIICTSLFDVYDIQSLKHLIGFALNPKK
jgi:hypothetical protein